MEQEKRAIALFVEPIMFRDLENGKMTELVDVQNNFAISASI
jgi:hypothetical protein